MRKSTTPHISQAIKEVFEGIDKINSTGPSKSDILSAWHKAAGPKAAKHTSPAALKDKTLLVNVDSTVWMYHLRLKEAVLLKKIDRLLKLKGQNIQRIRFRAGEILKNQKPKIT